MLKQNKFVHYREARNTKQFQGNITCPQINNFLFKLKNNVYSTSYNLIILAYNT